MGITKNKYNLKIFAITKGILYKNYLISYMGYRNRLYHLGRRNFYLRYSFIMSRRLLMRLARKKAKYY